MMTKTIDLIYFNAGGGHRSAAMALQSVIATEQRPWNVRLVNLFEVLDSERLFQKLTGLAPEDLYNHRLKRGWTLGLSTELKVLQAMIRMGHVTMLRKLEQYWHDHPTDLVVSLVPNFNKVLNLSVKRSMPTVPYVTVMTDMADYPPHFWIESGLDQHIVCGTERAVVQAQEAGYSDSQISRTSGMILKPAFHQALNLNRKQEMARLGLNPERPTGIVMFGGHGSSDMLRIAKKLPDVQLIHLCGHHVKLAAQLNALPTKEKHLAIGFAPNIERYFSLGDFFIGKPGPASISEAIQMGLPVITVENSWTMPQERFNTTWIREQGVGVVIPSLRNIRQTVFKLLETLQTYRASVAKIENHAVFEVVEILAQQLSKNQENFCEPVAQLA